MSYQKKLNIEASLARSINQAPGLDFDKLASQPVVKLTGHDPITRQQPPAPARQWQRQHRFRSLSVGVAGCLVILVCVTTWFMEFKSPESIIALDANQSVEIVTNKHKQILSVKAFDQDVQELLDEENLGQTNLEDSVGVIITAMIKNGYLDENSSVVMVTVENQSTAKADDLASSLNQVIKDSATAENLSATVVKQTVTPDSQAVTEAEQYSVSTGKLNVMKELIVADSSLTMEALASMSLTDLLAVSKEKAIDLTKVITVDETQKDTKHTGNPGEDTAGTPIITPAPTTTTDNQNPAPINDGTTAVPVEDPVVNDVPTPPTDPIVITPAPVEPVVTPPEKETEAVEGEKKPLSEGQPEPTPTAPAEPEPDSAIS